MVLLWTRVRARSSSLSAVRVGRASTVGAAFVRALNREQRVGPRGDRRDRARCVRGGEGVVQGVGERAAQGIPAGAQAGARRAQGAGRTPLPGEVDARMVRGRRGAVSVGRDVIDAQPEVVDEEVEGAVGEPLLREDAAGGCAKEDHSVMVSVLLLRRVVAPAVG